MPRIRIRSRQGDYAVEIGRNLLAGIARHDAVRDRHSVVVTTPRVLALWGQSLLAAWPRRNQPTVLLHPDGERAKSLREYARLQSELAHAGARRDSILVALGGGVTGDLAGFLAATYMRGIGYVQVPTTLLAQVDSAIGGKTGVDIPEGKNLVGAFHPPLAVMSDIDTLATLPDREFRAGLFECIKSGILGDAALFHLLETKREQVLGREPRVIEQVVTRTARVKARIVSADEHESGQRMLLNFGHTFGHAIETALHYRALKHGEAVAWGMLAAITASERSGMLRASEAQRMRALIQSYGPLPRFGVSDKQVFAAMNRDKKHTRSSQRFILTAAIGEARVAELPAGVARAALRTVLAEAAR